MKKNIYINCLIFGCFCLFAMSCSSYKYYNAVNAEFKIIEVQAVDLEEDDWPLSSGSDEVITKYLLSAFDSNGKVVDQKGKSYGPYDFTYRGQIMTGFQEVKVRVPPKGQLVISVVLEEDDDYSSVSTSVNDLETLVSVAQYAVSLKASKSTSNVGFIRGLKVMGRVLNYAGIIVTVVDFFDTNDILLRSCIVVTAEQLKKLGNQTIFQALRAAREHNSDYYDYRLSYRLKLTQDYRDIKKEKDREYMKSPFMYISFSPYVSGGNINEYWTKDSDVFIYKDPKEKDRYLWGEGLFNSQYEFELGVLLSPTINLGTSGNLFSRFYLNLGYRQSDYYANFKNHHFLYDTETYFGEKKILLGTTFKLDGISMKIKDFMIGASYDIMTPRLLLQFGGGVIRRTGNLSFIKPLIDNGYKFKYDNNTEIFDNTYIPYASFDIGLGQISRKGGVLFNIGSQFLFKNSSFNDSFKIYDLNNNSKKISSEFEKKGYLYISFGLRFML